MISRILLTIIVLWLAIGVVATGQRGYFHTNPSTCASASTLAVTILAGPLNYAGVNPKIESCSVPKPSS